MKLIMILMISLCFVGCAGGGQHCIKIGGTYENVQGDIEYCYNAPQSKQSGVPTLDSEKGKAMLVPESELVELVKAAQPDPKNVSAKTAPSKILEKYQAILKR